MGQGRSAEFVMTSGAPTSTAAHLPKVRKSASRVRSLGISGRCSNESLWDNPSMAFVAPYLGPAPSHGPADWMPAIPVLKWMGWGLVPVYVGQQVIGAGSHIVTAAQGAIDAQNAASLASSATLDSGSVLYLDIENGGMMPSAQVRCQDTMPSPSAGSGRCCQRSVIWSGRLIRPSERWR